MSSLVRSMGLPFPSGPLPLLLSRYLRGQCCLGTEVSLGASLSWDAVLIMDFRLDLTPSLPICAHMFGVSVLHQRA
ncbi:hypothetical protein P171DRAFT_430660 [Karstenula rhodostoma CBS 690.94]|uniref:Uncharacterized protein n=1 Tax=Karstenula rhodostoma CBS 690.94 TaxID=1392251 RepID=A0A9P4UCA8_9PLEO|nr:hypothetical protein P171DRAFT_430660 [Karstenula rhodostoma CBS 690.94]